MKRFGLFIALYVFTSISAFAGVEYERGSIYQDLKNRDSSTRPEYAETRFGISASTYFPKGYRDSGFERSTPWIEVSVLSPVTSQVAIRSALGGMAMSVPVSVSAVGGTHTEDRSAMLVSPMLGLSWTPFSSIRGVKVDALTSVAWTILGRTGGFESDSEFRGGIYRLSAGYAFDERWMISVSRTFGSKRGTIFESPFSAAFEIRL